MARPERVRDVAAAVVAVAREKRLPVAAAGVAYYAFNTLIPLCLLLVVGLSVSERLAAVVQGVASPLGVDPMRVESLFRRFGGDAAGRLRAIGIALAIFLWSSVRLFRQIRELFAEVYGVRTPEWSLRTAADVALAVVVVALAMALLGVLGVALPFAVDGRVWVFVAPLAMFLALLVVFVPMYYRFPGVGMGIRESLPGAVLSAATWSVSGVAFRLYARTSESVQLYGVAGAVMLLLTWMYFGSAVLLFGAVVNAVLGGRVEIDPEWLPGDSDSEGEESR